MKKGRVIVTYGRSIIALMIAQSLGSRGIDIIGCDSVDLTVLGFSKFVSKNCIYEDPSDDEDLFVKSLLKIVIDNKPDDDSPYVLMPAFKDAKIIAKHREKFEKHVIVGCPDFEAIDKVDHKDAFALTTQKLGVRSPRTWLPENGEELDKTVEEIDFPVFVKPPDEVGGRGISKVETEKQLKTAFSELQAQHPEEQILIQEGIEGVDYCFCGLFDHGELVASMVYHNLQKFPNKTGAGVVRETVESERFDDPAKKLMGPLKWHGVAGIDFMWDEKESSQPYMIEVNPRFWAGLDHSVKSNVDFPWLFYQMLTDQELDTDFDVNIGKKTSLPGLSTMARVEKLFEEAINFEELEAQWPEIRERLNDAEISKATEIFTEAISNSISLDKALETFQKMRKQSKEAQKMSYAKDDPFIGLGALFILGSLLRKGRLPPELSH